MYDGNKKDNDCSFSSLKKRVNKQAKNIEALNKLVDYLLSRISKILVKMK